MKRFRTASTLTPIWLIWLMVTAPALAGQPPAPPWFTWTTVVNNNDTMPETSPRYFNSYNQPSVNAVGRVVFRARSKGGGGTGQQAATPTHGIYTRDMSVPGNPIKKILDRSTHVPFPNNLETTFIETPSFPRIDLWGEAIVTRGNHQPVLTYTPENLSESTKTGTTGIYSNPSGALITGVAKLGNVPGFAFFAVPGSAPPIAFDVFPGAPSVTDGVTIVFKGNYALAAGKGTGVYFRSLKDTDSGEPQAVEAIADTGYTAIPGTDLEFGSVSPPSAADGLVVFTGFDNEQSPALGGIYLAPLAPNPQLTPLVTIGARVPGESVRTIFTKIGETLAFDGRYVGFWGAWGSEARTVRMYCPEKGNKARIAYCNNTGDFEGDKGDPNSVCNDLSDDTDRCYQEKKVPVNQGIFVHDTQTGRTTAVAKTDKGFDDFLFWSYSGRVPGVGGCQGEEGGPDGGEDDGELVRWHASAFVAVSGCAGQTWNTVFKAVKGPVVGIYLAIGPGQAVLTVLDTTTDGQTIDPEAPAGLLVSEVGLEREGLRGEYLVVNARMGVEGDGEEEGMAGIYLTRMPIPPR